VSKLLATLSGRVKSYENPFTSSQIVITHGRKDRQEDMAKAIDAFSRILVAYNGLFMVFLLRHRPIFR
jgi:hypothetical protein